MDGSIARTEAILRHLRPVEQAQTSGCSPHGTTATSSPVSLVISDGVAIITMDYPPMNAFHPSVAHGLRVSYDTAFADPVVKAVVLTGAQGKFMAGADITVLQAMQKADNAEEKATAYITNCNYLCRLIEDGPKPTVAAIERVALGGGLELAMCASHRVCTPGTALGLPELKLGLIPGIGGTQRLPRLIGVAKAVQAMLLSRPFKEQEALKLGLIDAVVPREALVEEAKKLALSIAGGSTPRRYSLRETKKLGPAEKDQGILTASRKEAARQAPGLDHPQACLDAVTEGVCKGSEHGLKKETACFIRVFNSEVARSLIHIFFSQRATAKIPGVTDRGMKPRPIKKVGVIGGGLMGSGIATALVLSGYQVILKEVNQGFLDMGLSRVTKNLESRVRKGRMSQEAMDACMKAITPKLDFGGFETLDMVIEAVIENIELKQSIFAELEKICTPQCILATNTSTIDITLVSQKTKAQSRLLGMHFFSPAHVMPLVEIIRTEFTDHQVLLDTVAVAQKMGKTPVVVGNCIGFTVNRMFFPYGQAASFLVDQGLSPYRVDKVLKELGMPMGPFRMCDLVGLDVMSFVNGIIGKAYGERTYRTPLADEMLARKRFGEKTGIGYYKHAAGRADEDPSIDLLLEVARQKTGLIRALLVSDLEIGEIVLFPVINEACRIIAEGHVFRPSDIDICSIMGYGFPAHRGGILHWGDTFGAPYIYKKLMEWTQRFNTKFFEPCDYLRERALSNVSLAAPCEDIRPSRGVHRSLDDIVVVAACRTAVGKAGRGGLSQVPPDDLLSVVLREVLRRAPGVDPALVGDVVVGTVLGKGDQAATENRVACMMAGIPEHVPVRLVNRLCSSGLQAVADVAAAIHSGQYDIGIAAGVESMSRNRMLLDIPTNPKATGTVKGCYLMMGQTSENVAERYGVSREKQDQLAVSSHAKALAAIQTGKMKDEIVPFVTTVTCPKTGQTRTITVATDEGVRPGTTMESLAKLRPVFRKGGSTTAGNASQLSDGASAVLIMTRRVANRLNVPILGVLRSFGVVGVEPSVMGIGPAYAIPPVVDKAGLKLEDVDIYEINEAFASQAVYCVEKLGLDWRKVNPKGGAIALGHPLGCTGARMTTSLLYELKRAHKRYGVVSMCVGTGMGAAAVFENEDA